ncbi:unnamed protein product [Spodoptera littoralis]|uniref:Uncharacterized protein n=1 Tax=Spodoptera littoralis TaxID=7109 RepID=A0A9P0IEI2_SPOLI|nr:unnamed protein product [Spodoptera littoralis]CAH1644371.1 unnamed protein product [Spodoptera littoralis]
MENHNLSCEPMDIDTSGHSVRDMDISYDEPFYMSTVIKTEKEDFPSEETQLITDNTISDIQPTVKKFHINMQRPTKSYKNVLFQPVTIGMVILMSIFALHIYSLKCFDDFNVEELRDTLTNQVFGQSEAINSILETLEQQERSKLIIFSGGTGVGKTLISSILLNSLGPCSNVYHYTMPGFINTFSTDFMYGLTMCKKSLLIVDDLTANDIMQSKIHIQKVIEKSEYLAKETTVILIYNCYESTADFKRNCDESFRHKLLENFSEIKVLKRFVEFKPLTKYHLKQCIRQELADRQLNDRELEDVLRNFNVDVDGCKGVHSKMKYLNIV